MNKEDVLKLAREKGFDEAGENEVIFLEDRYSGAYSGNNEIVILFGFDRYGNKWAEDMIWADDLTAASFWYSQKCLSYQDRCAFTMNEFICYLKGEPEFNEIGDALFHTKVFKEVEVTKKEMQEFLLANNLNEDGKPISSGTTSSLRSIEEGDIIKHTV